MRWKHHDPHSYPNFSHGKWLAELVMGPCASSANLMRSSQNKVPKINLSLQMLYQTIQSPFLPPSLSLSKNPFIWPPWQNCRQYLGCVWGTFLTNFHSWLFQVHLKWAIMKRIMSSSEKTIQTDGECNHCITMILRRHTRSYCNTYLMSLTHWKNVVFMFFHETCWSTKAHFVYILTKMCQTENTFLGFAQYLRDVVFSFPRDRS